MKTHELVQEYKGSKDFSNIAKSAANFANSNKTATELDVLSFIEEKFGKPKKKEKFPNNGRKKNLTILGRDLIEMSAINQMYEVMNMPVVTEGSLMPDAHLGYAMPIGGVASLKDALSPSLVGFDISCMVQLTIFSDYDESLIETAIEAIKNNVYFGGKNHPKRLYNHKIMKDKRWNELEILKNLKDLAHVQLGTSGSGNHFVNLVRYEDNEGNQSLGLLSHSGSRGVGHQIASHFMKIAERETSKNYTGVPKGYEWLEKGTQAFKDYELCLYLMGDYAKANHDCIHNKILKDLGLKKEITYFNRHNFVWNTNEGYIHRKGATPARLNEIGLIPATCGTPSRVVIGLGNTDYMQSSSHGSGRVGSRTQAKKDFDKEIFDFHMNDNKICHYGVAEDEGFEAYKDIDKVMSHQEGIVVDTMAKLHPLAVFMGGSQSS